MLTRANRGTGIRYEVFEADVKRNFEYLPLGGTMETSLFEFVSTNGPGERNVSGRVEDEGYS